MGAGVHQAGLVLGQHKGWMGKPTHFSLDFILVHLTPSQLCKGIYWSFITHLQAHWYAPLVGITLHSVLVAGQPP